MNLESLRDRAANLYRQGDLPGAERVCLEILEKITGCAVTYHLLGVIRLQQRRSAEAVALFDRALAIKPDYAETLANRGTALRHLNRHQEALLSYERALTINPNDPIGLNNRGTVLLDLGYFQQALESCEKAIALHPGYVSALNSHGNALRHLGRCEDALASFDKALTIAPTFVNARFNRGLTLYKLGRFREAIADFDRVVSISPSDFDAWSHRGAALYRAGNLPEALASYGRALVIAPNNIDILNDRGTVLLALQRFEEALSDFDQVVSVESRHSSALSNRGAALQGAGRSKEALKALNEALALEPQSSAILYNRGIVLQSLERYKEALESYDACLARNPNNASCWNNRGGVLQSLERLDDALTSYDRAIFVSPTYSEAWANRGSLLRELRRPDDALQSYNKALTIKPQFVSALSSRSNLLWVTYRDYEGSLRDLERAAEIDPDYPYIQGDLLHLRMYGAHWHNFERHVANLDNGVRTGKRVATPFVYQVVSESPKDLQSCSVLYASDRYPARYLPVSARSRHRKICVGYVSGEFREQATSFLIAGLYEHHDRDRFDIVAFDNGRNDGSATRKRLEAAFERFIDISMLSDEAAARAIEANNVDILVNLNGYFGEGRMGIFAHRPAPIQVNYLGFPGTLGAEYIDYIIADRVVIPESELKFYNEQVIYLPDSYQVNDGRRLSSAAIPSRSECGLPEAGFIFCNFNQSYKITPSMFAIWMKILTRVEGSVLWLLESNKKFSENIRLEARRSDVSPHRLVFAPLMAMNEHIARHRVADLFLDTAPCNAHTGASDALWAGLPLVTCRGTTFPGRVAASLLHAIRLPELAVDTLAEYENLAVELAIDPKRLKCIRQRLWKNRRTTPLFDTDRYRRNLEAAYTAIWENHLQGIKPRDFSSNDLEIKTD